MPGATRAFETMAHNSIGTPGMAREAGVFNRIGDAVARVMMPSPTR